MSPLGLRNGPCRQTIVTCRIPMIILPLETVLFAACHYNTYLPAMVSLSRNSSSPMLVKDILDDECSGKESVFQDTPFSSTTFKLCSTCAILR